MLNTKIDYLWEIMKGTRQGMNLEMNHEKPPQANEYLFERDVPENAAGLAPYLMEKILSRQRQQI